MVLPAAQFHSPADWDQIEDAEEVRTILSQLSDAVRYDVYSAAALYDDAYPGYPGDSDFYLEKGKHGEVLYLGVGTGRIFSAVAKRNPKAVGIDLSGRMLDRLRELHPRIGPNQLLQGDASAIELPPNSFDTVIAPYSFLQVVDHSRLDALLRNVQKCLKPGGSFYTDTFSPYLIPFRKKGMEANIRRIGRDTRIAIYVLYDHLKQEMTEFAEISGRGRAEVLEMHLHYYFPQEIVDAFERTGLGTPDIYGGYEGEEFNPVENEVLVYRGTKSALSNNGQPSTSTNGRRLNRR